MPTMVKLPILTCAEKPESSLVYRTRQGRAGLIVYLSVPRSQLGWFNLPHSPTLPPSVTVEHRVVKF